MSFEELDVLPLLRESLGAGKSFMEFKKEICYIFLYPTNKFSFLYILHLVFFQFCETLAAMFNLTFFCRRDNWQINVVSNDSFILIYLLLDVSKSLESKEEELKREKENSGLLLSKLEDLEDLLKAKQRWKKWINVDRMQRGG